MNTTWHAVVTGHQKIAYQKDGRPSGLPPLVLLHGFCEDSSIWDDWITRLPAMLIIRIDLPGFGQSDLPPDTGIEHYAHAVKAVLDKEQEEKFVLVGHSLGGYTALAFAELYPEMLVGMGLFHSHPFADTAEQKENRNRGIEMVRSGKKDLYVAQLFPKLFEDDFEKKQPEKVQQTIRKGQEQSAEGIINALESMKNRPDRSTVLANAKFPVLFLLGKKDVLIPYETVLKVAAQLTESEVHLPEGAAHMGMLEAAEMTGEIVGAFWRRVVMR